MFGHGLKHLFHSRRRSREREHPSSQDPQQQQQGMSDHESPDEKERSPEMHRVSYAMSLHFFSLICNAGENRSKTYLSQLTSQEKIIPTHSELFQQPDCPSLQCKHHNGK